MVYFVCLIAVLSWSGDAAKRSADLYRISHICRSKCMPYSCWTDHPQGFGPSGRPQRVRSTVATPHRACRDGAPHTAHRTLIICSSDRMLSWTLTASDVPSPVDGGARGEGTTKKSETAHAIRRQPLVYYLPNSANPGESIRPPAHDDDGRSLLGLPARAIART